MTEIMYEIPSRDDVEKCIITKETIEDGNQPKLILEGGETEQLEATAS
jgi:ATP-dependent Clp protease ATP-binding subunit ClpX